MKPKLPAAVSGPEWEDAPIDVSGPEWEDVSESEWEVPPSGPASIPASRNLGFVENAVADVVRAKKAEALARQAGMQSNVGEQERGRVQDYAATLAQQRGGPEASARAVTPSGAIETPGAIRTFLEAGMRPAGTAMVSLAEQSENRIRRENPGLSEKEINRRVIAEQSGLGGLKRWLGNPREVLEAAKQAAFSYHPLDPKHEANAPGTRATPTVIKAVPQIIERYGEEAGAVEEPVFNALRALYQTSEAVVPSPVTAISRLAQGQHPFQSPFGPLPPEEEKSTKSIPAPWGRMTAPQGAALGTAAAFTPAGDVSQLVLGGLGKGVGGVAKGVAGGFERVAPKVAGAINKAGEAAASGARTSGPGKFFLGTPAIAEDIAVSVGHPEWKDTLSRALTSVGPRQNMEMALVNEAVAKAKKVGPAEVDDFWRYIQTEGPRSDLAYQRLSPQAREAADAYKKLSQVHGASIQETAGTIPRERYAYGGLKPEALEHGSVRGTPPPAGGIPEVAPRPGGFHKQATLQETLASEVQDYPVQSIPDVQRAINEARGPIAADVRARWGPSPLQSDPAKNIVQRFGQGALEKPWAETIAEVFVPMARQAKSAPQGWAFAPKGSLAEKILAEKVGPNAILPKPAMDVIAKGLEPKTGLDKLLENPLIQAWKSMVTTVSGPAYHARNAQYNLGKLADEARPDELFKIEEQMARLKAGAPEFAPIVRAAKEGATWAGTGAPPGATLSRMKRSVGLPTRPPLDPAAGKVTRTVRKAQEAWDRLPSPGRKVYEAAGDAATAVDEAMRMRAILLYVNRGMTPEQAVAKAKGLITFTGEKTPFEKSTAVFSPFATWTLREAPRAARRMAGGGLTWPVKVQNYMEATTPTEEQVPERFQPRRFREQSGVPLAGKSPEGLQRGMAIPASPVGPVSQMFDAPVLASQGGETGEVLKAGARTALNMAYPPLMWMGAEAGGFRPLTAQPLEATERATPQQIAIAETFPDIADSLGIFQGKDGEWYASARSKMYFGLLPYVYPARIATSKDPEEKKRALWNYLTGVPQVPLDPSRENMVQGLLMKQRVKETEAKAKRKLGIPRLP